MNLEDDNQDTPNKERSISNRIRDMAKNLENKFYTGSENNQNQNNINNLNFVPNMFKYETPDQDKEFLAMIMQKPVQRHKKKPSLLRPNIFGI